MACHPTNSPMEQHIKLSQDVGDLVADPASYRRLIRRLIYLTISRPDITFSVHQLSQFMQSSCKDHLDAAYRILRYLKGTIGHGILLPSGFDLQLSAFCDSDWASCPMTRRSTLGYITFLGSSPIS